MARTKKTVEKENKVTYTKEALLHSKVYQCNRDVLNVLLKDDERYSIDEVNKLIQNFMKGKVK